MEAAPSFVFLSTPTSGTGSMWRVISAIAAMVPLELDKVSERHALDGSLDALPGWQPEPRGFGYMYNTPHVVNEALARADVRLIVNFRDPRDMACNQYHWALQHPLPVPATEAEAYREHVRKAGLDAFVLAQDNNVHFAQFRRLQEKLARNDPANLLVLSYARLCLDFDGLVADIADFLGVPREQLPWEAIEPERVQNLHANPAWIGRDWSGTDTAPGRHRSELRQDTIERLDETYRDALSFLRGIERQEFRELLATDAERAAQAMVLVGADGQLFLQADSNDTPGQVIGRLRLGENHAAAVAAAHQARAVLGSFNGYRYIWAVVPSKEVVLRACLPDEVPFESMGARPMRRFLESPYAGMARPFYAPSLLEGLGMRAYPREDTHWAFEGAIHYLQCMLAERWPELGARFEAIGRKTFASRQRGDLGAKLYRDPEPIEIVVPAQRRAAVTYTNRLSNEGSVVVYSNPECQAGQRLLVLHDSFGVWWFDFLAELFDEVVFIHATIFDQELVALLRPTHVLCLQAERFFVRAPQNFESVLDFVSAQEAFKGTPSGFADYVAARMQAAGGQA